MIWSHALRLAIAKIYKPANVSDFNYLLFLVSAPGPTDSSWHSRKLIKKIPKKMQKFERSFSQNQNKLLAASYHRVLYKPKPTF